MEYYHKHVNLMGIGGLVTCGLVGWALMNGAPLFGLLFPVWFLGAFFWRLSTPAVAIREEKIEVPAVPIDLVSDETIALDDLDSFEIEDGGLDTLYYDKWVVRGGETELTFTPTIIRDSEEDELREQLTELADGSVSSPGSSDS